MDSGRFDCPVDVADLREDRFEADLQLQCEASSHFLVGAELVTRVDEARQRARLLLTPKFFRHYLLFLN